MDSFFQYLPLIMGAAFFLVIYINPNDKPVQDNQTDQKTEVRMQVLNSKKKFIAPIKTYLKILKEERQQKQH